MPSATSIPNAFLRLVVRWGLATASIVLVAYVLDGFHVKNLLIAILAAPTLAFLNMTLGLVLRVITKPMIFVTLGLFMIVINASLLWLASLLFGSSMQIDHFGWAVLAAVLISACNIVFSLLFKKGP